MRYAFCKNAFLFFLLAAGTMACRQKEKNPTSNQENEFITTVLLHVTPTGGSMVMAQWKDLTPDDAAARTIDTLRLSASTSYTGLIEFFDDSKSPVRDHTYDIKSEAADHLLIYQPLAPLTSDNLIVTRTDKDQNNREVGLRYTLQTGVAGTGSLRIILKHQPGVKDGTDAPGDTDVDVSFPVKIR